MPHAPGMLPVMKDIIQTPDAPAAIGPYSQATVFGNLVVTSGQIPLTPDGTLVEGGITEQTEQVIANLKAVLAAAGTDLARVVKTTVFLADLKEWPAMNEVYRSYFSNGNYPARAAVQATLLFGARVEMECAAAAKSPG